MHVGFILGLAEQKKFLRRRNEQSVPTGVRAEKVKGLLVHSFSEKDAELSDNCLVALSKGKEKNFFACNTEINVEHITAHPRMRARAVMGN